MKSANNCAKFTITINSEERKFQTTGFEILINQTTDDSGWRCPVAFVYHSLSPHQKKSESMPHPKLSVFTYGVPNLRHP
ncbi:hypothetical protein CEXT_682671 [Caerostris extrusa]|uniref:Uncharacterized protein n=1 Tax=Caerostris extrusa TaxID=172846 RepID=A0AAV4RI31_CAEEX|nr:hypothetical protein CEXT_682671 [Caerostris extrusa]